MTTATATRKPLSAKKLANRAAAAEARKAQAANMKTLAETFELDEDDAATMRAFESLTGHYSEGNALLILAQAAALGLKVRSLKDVGGFNAFAERGRAVKASEKSNRLFGIWARITRDDQEADMVKESTDGTKKRERFAVVGIYHISQTEAI
jgi:hypothetical protein